MMPWACTAGSHTLGWLVTSSVQPSLCGQLTVNRCRSSSDGAPRHREPAAADHSGQPRGTGWQAGVVSQARALPTLAPWLRVAAPRSGDAPRPYLAVGAVLRHGRSRQHQQQRDRPSGSGFSASAFTASRMRKQSAETVSFRFDFSNEINALPLFWRAGMNAAKASDG